MFVAGYLGEVQPFSTFWYVKISKKSGRTKKTAGALFVFKIKPFLLFQDMKIMTSSPEK